MTHPDVLADFILWLAKQDGDVELVINGDFIDFLAEEHTGEPKWRSFIEDPEEAETIFWRIAGERGGKGGHDEVVFDALADLLAAGKRLTLILGNHDLELSLPRVRAALIKRLGADRGAVQLIYDGEPYVIGDVLIEHGNRYDAYNEVDHGALRRLRSLQARRQDTARAGFKPPVGSRLVADFINPVKETYGFIDLLKPEGAALMALLLAMDPSQRILGSLLRARWQVRGRGPFDEQPAMPRRRGAISKRRREPKSVRGLLKLEGVFSEALLEEADWLPTGGEISRRGKRHIIGLDIFGRWMSKRKRLEYVKAALRALPDPDLSFDERVETDEAYAAAAERLTEEGFQVVILGHSHHAKDITFASGRRYLNTGAWANLMSFPAALLQEDQITTDPAWTQFAEDLKANRLDNYLRFHPSAVRLRFDGEELTETMLLTDVREEIE